MVNDSPNGCLCRYRLGRPVPFLPEGDEPLASDKTQVGCKAHHPCIAGSRWGGGPRPQAGCPPAAGYLDTLMRSFSMTPRQAQVLGLVVDRYSNPEIARLLSISKRT